MAGTNGIGGNCCCSGGSTCSFTWTFTVYGCNGVGTLSGASVVVTGALSASGYTDGSGQVSFTFTDLPSGSYSCIVYFDGPSGCQFATDVRFYNIKPCDGDVNSTFIFDAASGFSCQSASSYPIPNTLYYSDDYGSCTLIGSGTWSGSYTYSSTFAMDGACNPGTFDITVSVSLYTATSVGGNWTLTLTKLIKFAGVYYLVSNISCSSLVAQMQGVAPATTIDCGVFDLTISYSLVSPPSGVPESSGTATITS